jgi:hypothetical protein
MPVLFIALSCADIRSYNIHLMGKDAIASNRKREFQLSTAKPKKSLSPKVGERAKCGGYPA